MKQNKIFLMNNPKPNDKITLLNKRLKKLVEAMEDLKRLGMNEEILIIYVSHKTKLPLRDVKAVIENVEDFYRKLLGKEMFKKLNEI